MTKLFLIAALMTLSFAAFAQVAGTGQTTADASAATANENCDVRVVPEGGEPSGGSSAGETQGGGEGITR